MVNVAEKQKKQIDIDQAVPGMIIAQCLINDFGGIVLHEDTILTASTIIKLKNLGYRKILAFDMTENEIEETRQHFEVTYNEGKYLVKDMIKDLGNGKPVDMEKLQVVTSLLTEKFDNTRDIIDTMSKMRESSEYTYTHSMNVALLCSLLGRWLGFDETTIRHLTHTGLLHDVGKVKIPLEILEKPYRLSEAEFQIMKQHSTLGYQMLCDIPGINQDIQMGVLMHHEREDGSGYPLGTTGDQIHYFAKIAALADIYDAMTSERCYKSRQSPFDVLEMFENQSFGILDPKYLMTFTSNIANYYIGDMVRLNTGEVAEIIFINPLHVSKPLVRVGDNYLDLFYEKNIKIDDLL